MNHEYAAESQRYILSLSITKMPLNHKDVFLDYKEPGS
jgi:hypothetical protein